MLRFVHTRILVIALLGVVVACEDATPGDPAAPVKSEAQVASAAKQPKQEAKREKQPRRERPLPNLAGRTLGGERLEVSSMLGKRLVVFFFNPEVKAATAATRAIGEVSKLRGKYNFDILGIATGSDRETTVSFARENGVDFRVLDDSSAAIARRMGLRQPMAMIGVDSDGYILFGIQQFMSHAPDAERAIETQIREALRLPHLASASEPAWGNRPVAPLFTVDILDGQERFDLAAHRGGAVVVKGDRKVVELLVFERASHGSGSPRKFDADQTRSFVGGQFGQRLAEEGQCLVAMRAGVKEEDQDDRPAAVCGEVEAVLAVEEVDAEERRHRATSQNGFALTREGR